MKYTKEQLQAISDFEVNNSLDKLLGFTVARPSIDYCSKPSDIMPLAFERKIALEPAIDAFTKQPTGEWFATINIGTAYYCEYLDANPLRAIACCLILVLQEKQE